MSPLPSIMTSEPSLKRTMEEGKWMAERGRGTREEPRRAKNVVVAVRGTLSKDGVTPLKQ